LISSSRIISPHSLLKKSSKDNENKNKRKSLKRVGIKTLLQQHAIVKQVCPLAIVNNPEAVAVQKKAK
jgi:hypothetical protein